MKRLFVAALACLTLLSFQSYAEDQFFDSNGVQIRYLVQGEGEPLVLIHGFSANIELNFGMPGLLDSLAQDYQVIALDCRGHGKSGKPHGAENYGMEMVHDVARLLDHLGIERAHVSGYSMGGFLTMRFLTEYPERVLSAIPGGAGWPSEDIGTANRDMRDELAESLEAGKGIGPLIVGLTPEGRPLPTEEQLAQMNTLLMATNDSMALAGVIRGMEHISISQATLEDNTVPTMVLIGEIDPLKESVDPLLGVMSNLEVVVLNGRDHMSAFADPGYAMNMKRFLQAHSPAVAAERTD